MPFEHIFVYLSLQCLPASLHYGLYITCFFPISENHQPLKLPVQWALQKALHELTKICWESAGSPLAVRWQSAGSQLAVRWQSTGSPLGVHWESTGNPLGVRWEFIKWSLHKSSPNELFYIRSYYNLRLQSLLLVRLQYFLILWS